jgi:protein-tyrosine phosphatase
VHHDTLTPIIPGKLYQSGDVRTHPERLEKEGITAVLNLSYYGDPPSVVDSVEYVHWGIDDGPLPDLKKLHAHVAVVVMWVRMGEKVLVHCDAGLNRSGLVNALAVRELLGLSGTQAVAHVRICRQWALCNDTFVHYIESLETPRDVSGDISGLCDDDCTQYPLLNGPED